MVTVQVLYMMQAKLERRAPKKWKQNDWLVKHAYNVTSQGGEDGVIEQVFRILDDAEHATSAPPRRWCVEFGAWDGHHLSNTYNLLYNQPLRWSGVLIEADEDRVKEMKDRYASHSNVVCVQAFIELDGPNQLESILQRSCPELPQELDLLSIDVDGADYHIWDGLLHYHPKVVVIEFNPTIPNNVVFVQERSTKIYHGSSLAALIDLAKQRGYELISTTTFNAFFVQKRFYDLFQIQENAIDVMHDVPMPTEFFQLYDGTIKITGCKKLIWRKLPINEEDIQVLPRSARAFPFLPSDHDLVAAAQAKRQEFLKQKVQDYTYFVNAVNDATDKYRPGELQGVLKLGLSVCQDSQMRLKAQDAMFDICQQQFQHRLDKNCLDEAISWQQFKLKVDPKCNSRQRAETLAAIGECLVRQRKFEDAEFHLQTAHAILPEDKRTLKSLAKLYSKTKDSIELEKIVHMLRDLQ